MTTLRRNNQGNASPGSDAIPQDNTDGADHVHVNNVLPGGRQPASATLSYQVVRQEANLTVISQTAASTIGGGVTGDTHLMGLHIYAPLTGTCVITGFLDQAGVAQSITIPALTTAREIDFKGAINAGGPLTVTCSNAADDNLVGVLWRPV